MKYHWVINGFNMVVHELKKKSKKKSLQVMYKAIGNTIYMNMQLHCYGHMSMPTRIISNFDLDTD